MAPTSPHPLIKKNSFGRESFERWNRSPSHCTFLCILWQTIITNNKSKQPVGYILLEGSGRFCRAAFVRGPHQQTGLAQVSHKRRKLLLLVDYRVILNPTITVLGASAYAEPLAVESALARSARLDVAIRNTNSSECCAGPIVPRAMLVPYARAKDLAKSISFLSHSQAIFLEQTFFSKGKQAGNHRYFFAEQKLGRWCLHCGPFVGEQGGCLTCFVVMSSVQSPSGDPLLASSALVAFLNGGNSILTLNDQRS